VASAVDSKHHASTSFPNDVDEEKAEGERAGRDRMEGAQAFLDASDAPALLSSKARPSEKGERKPGEDNEKPSLEFAGEPAETTHSVESFLED